MELLDSYQTNIETLKKEKRKCLIGFLKKLEVADQTIQLLKEENESLSLL